MDVTSTSATAIVLRGNQFSSKAESAVQKEKNAVSRKASESNASLAENMTMREYKSYIHEKISELPVHPTQSNRSASVFISEEGFEAMKSDPSYEAWVLDKLREDFSLCNPIAAMHESFIVYQFGTKKSDYRGDSWYDGFQNGQGKQIYQARSQGSFWNEHAAKQKQILAQHNDDVQEQKRVSHEWEQQRFDIASVRESVANHRQNPMSAALSSYDANSVFLGRHPMGVAETITTKRFMPDGTIIVTTKKDGKIVEQNKKKPHLVPVPDGLTGKIKMEPFQSVFELMA